MNTVDEILNQVNDIFKDVLDNDQIVVKENTKADDIEEWDSLSHIQLIVAVEKHFKVRFTTPEINGFKNVGEMCQGIQAKLT